MAASLNLEEVIEKVLHDDCDSESSNSDEVEQHQSEDISERLRKCLAGLPVTDDEKEVKERFIGDGVRELVSLWNFYNMNSSVRSILDCQVNAGQVLQDETKTWLQSVFRRLSGRRSLRRPFYAEIHRQIPRAVFGLFVRVVRNADGFSSPFCLYVKKRFCEVVTVTSIRLVKELFCLLTGLSGSDVVECLKRKLSRGQRSGHKVSVIVNDEKHFVFLYKHRPGELTITFNYGEWNVCGAPQHN